MALGTCAAWQARAGNESAGLSPDPFRQTYENYRPDFIDKSLHEGGRREPSPELMDLSSEPSFFTLNLLLESERAYALIEAARERAAEGQHGEALDILHRVVEEYPDELYRVSPYGVFVPIAQYAQLRMLTFPPRHLALYRTQHDARAREAFELARQRHSLEGVAHVRDTMLATSYGAAALVLLGDAALDRGHYLEALERYTTVRDYFPDPMARTPELRLKIELCRKMLGDPIGKAAKRETHESASRLAEETLEQFRIVVDSTRPKTKATFEQRSSPPYVAADDYALMPPTKDPLGLKEPTWAHALSGSIRGARDWDAYVYCNPVVTENSVIYRHKNIVYCRSLLTGELRWLNNTGGRVTWQNWGERQYTHEDVLVQDGLVFTPLHHGGPSLAALDKITGQLRWAYGPMAATTAEEANLRFEAAPAGGPMTVYAGYILDNIEGQTHTDTEYGVMAFDSATGRIRWRRELGRLRPGRFVAEGAVRRNRIRSFASPPLYHQGTVYHTTNAGTIAALDALSGQIKWIMRYPYWYHPHAVHDATRRFGSGGEAERHTRMSVYPHRPMFWYAQRPLLIGDDLYVLPVNSKFLYKLCRRTGTVRWTAEKTGGAAYFLGPLPDGRLVMAPSGHDGRTGEEGPIVLLDPETGRVDARLEDPVAIEPQPSIRKRYERRSGRDPYNFMTLSHDRANYQVTARPFLGSDGRLIAGGFSYWGFPIFGFGSNLAVYDLNHGNRPVTERRRYFSSSLVSTAERAVELSSKMADYLEDLPNPPRKEIETLRAIAADKPVENEHPQFLPFARVTFERYNTRFELRLAPDQVAMVYDRAEVDKTLQGREDPEGLFGRAEVALRDGRLSEAADLMERCLAVLPSEATDFRTLIHQQLYQAHAALARGSVHARDTESEIAHGLGMSRAATTLGDELESRFVIAEAYERSGDKERAMRQWQSVVSTYGRYGYPMTSLQKAQVEQILPTARQILEQAAAHVSPSAHASFLGTHADLLAEAMPMYWGALSPLEKDLTLRAEVWAATRLNRLRQSSESFATVFEQAARAALDKAADEERLVRLPEYPGTKAAQTALEHLLDSAAAALAVEGIEAETAASLRRRLWRLADVAQTCALTVPEGFAARLLAPSAPPRLPMAFPATSRNASFEEERSPVWLTLERHGRHDVEPDLLFLGGRIRTRFDNKFLLYAVDARTGKTRWRATEVRGEARFDELRLEGLGDEPGFFDAYVHGDVVVTHGRYDVLAFRLKDGTLKWRYRAPFAFEIRHASQSGALLVLAGASETVALYLGTDDPRGEVAWQTREEGALYGAPYFHDDRWVSVRRQPFNLTTRSRVTGRLIGRLVLPDLTLHTEHPLVEDGPEALPLARDGGRLLVTDGWRYIMLDVEKMRIAWQRLVDHNDMSSEPPFRFAMGDGFLAVLKKDWDVNAIYMLSAENGAMLWRTDPKDRQSPQPLYSMTIRNGKLYGIRPHAGQGFYFVGLDCATGKDLFRPNEQSGYQSRPAVRLRPEFHGDVLVAKTQDRQDFELKAFRIADGKRLHTMRVKGTGVFGEHGRASATAQNGTLALLGGHELTLAVHEP